MSKRITKDEFEEMRSLGALKPVDYAILAFANDDIAADAVSALTDASFSKDDILKYSSREIFPDLDEMMRTASSAAGFGYEIVLMRRYMGLAQEGAGWVVVYAPDEEATGKIQDVAKRFDAKSAVRYGTLMHEDLV